MGTVQVEIPDELLKAAGVSEEGRSQKVAKLLALELYRERVVSLGKAARLCGISIAEFMIFAGEHEVELDFDAESLEQDRRTLEDLNL